MIYDSLDIIPAKLFLKIEETADVLLLSTEKTDVDLVSLWEKLKEDDQRLYPDKQTNKTLDISKSIEQNRMKYKSVTSAIYYLRRKKDLELIELLQGYGYRLRNRGFLNDLNLIEREVEGLKSRIKRLENKLPKRSEGQGAITFDEVVMSYGAITGSGFIDTNTITMTQYRALISIGNKKIKSLEDGGR